MPDTDSRSERGEASPALSRTMGLGALTIYGVGDMLGSGIYALVGKAAGIMGNAIWLAFVASMVAALLTGLSYACLGSRYPRAAGAAYITQRAYHRPFLAYLVGLAVLASGLTSMATASRAFAGYFRELFGAFPPQLLVAGFIIVLTAINYRGIRESTWVNILCTAVELLGLLFVVAVGLRFWGGVDYLEAPAERGGLGAGLLMQGAVLTFFSFVGFEDLLNVTEEVKDAPRTLPRGLVLAMLIVTAVYITVSITAISVVPYGQLAASGAPLVEVVRRAAPWMPPGVFTAVSIFAITNTALLNYIMGSRLAYGMARQGLLPAALGRIHARRRTPHVAILALMAVVLTLALAGDISVLAIATSLLLLFCFVVVNGALLVLKLRPGEPPGNFEVPAAVPAAGAAVCAALIVGRILIPGPDRWAAVLAGGLLAGIALLYAVTRPKRVLEQVE